MRTTFVEHKKKALAKKPPPPGSQSETGRKFNLSLPLPFYSSQFSFKTLFAPEMRVAQRATLLPFINLSFFKKTITQSFVIGFQIIMQFLSVQAKILPLHLK